MKIKLTKVPASMYYYLNERNIFSVYTGLHYEDSGEYIDTGEYIISLLELEYSGVIYEVLED